MIWKTVILFLSLTLSIMLVEDTIENIINSIKTSNIIDKKDTLVKGWLALLTIISWCLFYFMSNQI